MGFHDFGTGGWNRTNSDGVLETPALPLSHTGWILETDALPLR